MSPKTNLNWPHERNSSTSFVELLGLILSVTGIVLGVWFYHRSPNKNELTSDLVKVERGVKRGLSEQITYLGISLTEKLSDIKNEIYSHDATGRIRTFA